MIKQITVLLLTYDEAPNLQRTLERLRWANRILLIDSGSTDKTLEIAVGFPNVEIISRPFESFADQCNFGLTQIHTEWVLSLDADYVLPTSFPSDVEPLVAQRDMGAFKARFRYCVEGHPLRASLYPPRTVLYRLEGAFYTNDGHSHRANVQGAIGWLPNAIDHDDRKPLSRWLWSQDRYASAEVDKLTTRGIGNLSPQDRLRQWIVIAPFAALLYSLFIRATILDGVPGLHYAFQRMVAELILSLRLLERRLASI
jgi:glycosyltransferase involved in cell wall biosynthesis